MFISVMFLGILNKQRAIIKIAQNHERDNKGEEAKTSEALQINNAFEIILFQWMSGRWART